MEERILKGNNFSNMLFVANIVTRILAEHKEDGEISDILLDDYGQCIQVTIKDAPGLLASTAMEIGQAFGDEGGANIQALGPDEFVLVFYNIKYWKEEQPTN